MKKIYLISILLFFFSFTGQSQIIYEYADFATAGDSYEYEVKSYEIFDSLPLSDFDENWDFSGYESDSLITINFVLPEETAFSDSFPNANLCMMDGAENFSYLNVQENGVELVGLATNQEELGIPFVYALDNDFMITQFPVRMNDVRENEITLTLADSPENLGLDLDSLDLPVAPDSIRIRVTLIDQAEIDAYGMVTLANGNHETIRENRMEILQTAIEVQVFSLWIAVPEFSFSDTTHSYHWLAKDHGFPIAEVFAGPNDMVFSISFLKTIPETVYQIAENEPLVYPNPVNDYLYLNDEIFETAESIVIFDLNGKLVKQFQSKHNQFKVWDLSSGIYMYSLFDKKGRVIHSQKFYKTH